MELTKAQIEKVENFLTAKNIIYVDIRLEILDHIVSDIENLMVKNYTFENAFKTTIIKWKNNFKETSSFYFGILYSESKLVIKKAVKMFKPFFFLYMSAYFLPVIFLNKFLINFSENTAVFLNGFLKSITALCFLYFIFIIIKVLQSKTKTTYSFVLKTQYLGIILLVIPLFIGNYFNDKESLNGIFIGFLLAGWSVTYICHYFYKKHKEAIKKYKTISI